MVVVWRRPAAANERVLATCRVVPEVERVVVTEEVDASVRPHDVPYSEPPRMQDHE